MPLELLSKMLYPLAYIDYIVLHSGGACRHSNFHGEIKIMGGTVSTVSILRSTNKAGNVWRTFHLRIQEISFITKQCTPMCPHLLQNAK
jgi:hypothetical protein